jgi:hypothetical protein
MSYTHFRVSNIINTKCLYDVSNDNMRTTGLIYIYCNELGLFYFTMEVYYTESSIYNS